VGDDLQHGLVDLAQAGGGVYGAGHGGP